MLNSCRLAPGVQMQKRELERICAAQANALADKLIKAGENFVAGLFFTAGYDPPFRLTGASLLLPLHIWWRFGLGTLRCITLLCAALAKEYCGLPLYRSNASTCGQEDIKRSCSCLPKKMHLVVPVWCRPADKTCR